jgi:hypothetical protein
MPKTITKTVYTFKELIEAANDPDSAVTSSAVEKARHWLQEGQTDHQWWDYVYEMWKQALEQVGFTNADIQFSGFWSPGDGASFTGSLDFGKLIAFLSKNIEPKKSIGVDKKGKELFVPYVVHTLGSKTTDERFSYLSLVSDSLTGSVERTSHRDSHKYTCHTRIDRDEIDDETTEQLTQATLDDLVPLFEEAVEDLRKDLCDVIYKRLEEEYKYLVSDEQLIETSDANEYTFDESGDYEP